MRVLISGSTGLIGTSLVEALKATPHTPVRLLRAHTQGSKQFLENTENVFWNPTEGRLADSALDGIDAVVHLAGAPIADRRWSDKYKAQILNSRTSTTALLANAIAESQNPPSVFLSGSAIGFYGNRGNEVLSEVSTAGDGFLADVVRAWEQAARVSYDRTRLAFLRTGVVLSANGGALATQLPFFRLGIGGRIGNGCQWLSWISIEDMVQAIIWLLDNELAGPINLTAPNPVTNTEFTQTLGRVLSRPTVIPIPKVVLWAKAGRELTEQMLYASQRVEPASLLAAGFQFRHAELEPALRSILGKPR